MFANFFLEKLGRESLIAPDDTWALLALLMVCALAACGTAQSDSHAE